MRSVSPSNFSSPSTYLSEYDGLKRKRRSQSDQTNDYSHAGAEMPALKRPRTAPSSPSAESFGLSKTSPSSQHIEQPIPQPSGLPMVFPVVFPVVFPALFPALFQALFPPSLGEAKPLRGPTVSLDYFDTYKPHDENWRYGLLDSIRSTRPTFSLEKYAYLEKHSAVHTLPSIHELGNKRANRNGAGRPNGVHGDNGRRPYFDSRVSSKALPTFQQRKVNFPYESNYTYLNKTYLNDVEKFPEYLELAQSLMQLSRPPTAEPVVMSANPSPYVTQRPVHSQEGLSSDIQALFRVLFRALDSSAPVARGRCRPSSTWIMPQSVPSSRIPSKPCTAKAAGAQTPRGCTSSVRHPQPVF
ncbi:hypothetical protein JCM33374_g3820 [Metschnikowia sp. JCM 33374]|nr:hypothetical protein JCM33374_g3820 [Metschnikowia sp. JCM 33374]